MMPAKPAVAVDTAHPRDSNARSRRQIGGCAFRHFADNLVPRDDARMKRREIAFDDVEVGAANSASNYLDYNMSWLQFRPGNIFDRNPTSGTTRTGIKNRGAHARYNLHPKLTQGTRISGANPRDVHGARLPHREERIRW
jgi:hypothetical protein